MSTCLAQPDRDLQCYFQTNPSYDYMYAAHTGIAAITQSSPTGLTLTGTFHDQFDWGVIEWNRDNQYEHLSLRPLPKGDLTGLTISWRELRSSNCILHCTTGRTGLGSVYSSARTSRLGLSYCTAMP